MFFQVVGNPSDREFKIYRSTIRLLGSSTATVINNLITSVDSEELFLHMNPITGRHLRVIGFPSTERRTFSRMAKPLTVISTLIVHQ